LGEGSGKGAEAKDEGIDKIQNRREEGGEKDPDKNNNAIGRGLYEPREK
jgi:hypothetical protein